MSIRTKTGAALRALLTAGPLGVGAGVVFGAAVGGAFLAGGMAQDAVVHMRATEIAQGMAGGLSDDSLRSVVLKDESGLSAALRYDPFISADDARTHQEAEFYTALNKLRPSAQQVRTAIVSNPAAQPWRASPLDEARQLECLSDAVYYEARGETPSGQAAVAQVVLNRVRHPSFPKSICAVVYQGAQMGRCQFSFACNGAQRGRREDGAWTRSRRVAERALGGYVMAEVGNATHFHVLNIRPGWRNMTQVASIGSHIFYRFGGRNGAPGAFTSEPQPEVATDVIIASLTLPTEVVASSAPTETSAVEPAAAMQPAAAVTAPVPAPGNAS